MREYIGYRRTPHLKVYKCVLRERERERREREVGAKRREPKERDKGEIDNGTRCFEIITLLGNCAMILKRPLDHHHVF